jgi:hypothetical protein
MADSMRILMRPASLVTLAAAAALVACTPGDGEGPPPQIALAVPTSAGMCSAWVAQPVERTCIPRMAMADRVLVLEIEQRCGACGSTAERCSVAVEGRTITLSLDGKTCEPKEGASCAADYCARNRARCSIPPLGEGRYQVRYGDTGGRVDSLDVVVRDDVPTTCILGEEGAGGPG